VQIVERYAEDAFVLLVTGLALIWPPLALVGAAAFFCVLAVLHWQAEKPAAVVDEVSQ